MHKTPKVEDLDCINVWPKETVGYYREKNVLIDLLLLCKEHGFGRIPQLAQEIEDIWRHGEEAKKKYMAQKKKHFKLMRKGWRDALGKNPCIYTEDRM